MTFSGEGTLTAEGTGILSGFALWTQWFEIGAEQEAQARAARAELVARKRRGLGYSPLLNRELTAGIVSVLASAAALDSLYGQLITPEIRAQGPKPRAARYTKVFQCLVRRFSTGRHNRHWAGEFRWLFKLRDRAVHSGYEFTPLVPHPSGIGFSAQECADYSAEAAMRATDLFREVMNICLANLKPNDAEAKRWAEPHADSFRDTEERLLVSREAVPLVVYDAQSSTGVTGTQ